MQKTQNNLPEQQQNEELSENKVRKKHCSYKQKISCKNIFQDNKYNNQLNDNDVSVEYRFTPEDVKYDNKHYKYIKYTTLNSIKKVQI